jgi:hypothetical protein
MDSKPHEAGKHPHDHPSRKPDDGRDPGPQASGSDPAPIVQLTPLPPPRGCDGDE